MNCCCLQVLSDYDAVWKEYDGNVDHVLDWVEYKKVVLARLNSGCGHSVGVSYALLELQLLEDEMESMCDNFTNIRDLGHKLLAEHSHVASLVVTENETRLYKAKNMITSTISSIRY